MVVFVYRRGRNGKSFPRKVQGKESTVSGRGDRHTERPSARQLQRPISAVANSRLLVLLLIMICAWPWPVPLHARHRGLPVRSWEAPSHRPPPAACLPDVKAARMRSRRSSTMRQGWSRWGRRSSWEARSYSCARQHLSEKLLVCNAPAHRSYLSC